MNVNTEKKSLWKQEIKENITTIEDLKNYINIDKNEELLLKKVIKRHPMNISRYYMSLINKEDPQDPIAKMAVPSILEIDDSTGSYDTSGEKENTKLDGLQHKYSKTALILSTSRCPMYCRHCFRKRLVGLSSKEITERFDRTIKYIKEHKQISNALITGGDSFMLDTDFIEFLLHELFKIPHISFVRFGTRTPVTFPDRIINGPGLVKTLKKYTGMGKSIYISTQFNHPTEITPESQKAVDMIIESGVIINNQTVLLKGVNDSPKTLADIQRGIISIRVNPYYVFQCRPVKRVKNHFQIPIARGSRIINEANKSLSGYSRRYRYVMSHKTGKIEIVGIIDNELYFRYHQAKDKNLTDTFFKAELDEEAGWLDELKIL